MYSCEVIRYLGEFFVYFLYRYYSFIHWSYLFEYSIFLFIYLFFKGGGDALLSFFHLQKRNRKSTQHNILLLINKVGISQHFFLHL